MTTIAERIAAQSMPIPWSGCHVWTGYTRSNGYGRLWVHGVMCLAHRVAYELERGAIAPGLQISHLCRNKACINVAHLRACTQSENLKYDYAAQPWGNQNTVKTHCVRGHSLTGRNLYEHEGKRYCIECKNLWKRTARAEGRYE